jgi:anion-transporting  ArsA/GET3 family ATPase
MSLESLLQTKRLVCTVGSGGVGKTTCAAALGLLASTLGRRALVLTIDPAKRLASAMGLGVLGADERVLGVEELQLHGVPAKGPLSVRMLDLKGAWDDMVRRLSPSPERAQTIIGNRFYTYLSTELAGAQEYIACEHLYALSYERNFDVVILDTPPTSNALNFLEAPDRVLAILNHEAVRWAARPAMAASRISLKIFDLAGGAAFKALERVTGVEVLKELGEFLLLFEGLFDPISDRTRAVQDLLTSDNTAFVLVTSPEPGPLRQAHFFLGKLHEMHLRVGSIVVNRLRQAPATDVDSSVLMQTLMSTGVSDGQAGRLLAQTLRAAQEAQHAVLRETHALAPLERDALGMETLKLPRLGDDVHDLRGLWHLCTRLHPTASGL